MHKRVNVSGRREEHKETTRGISEVEISVSVLSEEWAILKCYYTYIYIYTYLFFLFKNLIIYSTHSLTHSTAEFQRKM